MPVKMESNGRPEVRTTPESVNAPGGLVLLVCATPVPQADGSPGPCGKSIPVATIPTSQGELDALKCDECRAAPTTT